MLPVGSFEGVSFGAEGGLLGVEGTGSGYNGNITVKVTIKNDVITNLVVIDTVDNSPFVDTAISGIFDSILNSQSPDVDTVSGATFSSKGLISAVKAALKNAEN